MILLYFKIELVPVPFRVSGERAYKVVKISLLRCIFLEHYLHTYRHVRVGAWGSIPA